MVQTINYLYLFLAILAGTYLVCPVINIATVDNHLICTGTFIQLIHAESTFVTKNSNDNITFAINKSDTSSSPRISYYLSGPIGYSWIGKKNQ